jgi:hypothetical protein
MHALRAARRYARYLATSLAIDARAGVDPTLPERHLEDALRSAIADRRGYIDQWYVDDLSLWRVEVLSPHRETFGGRTLPQALAWALVWMLGTTGELGAVAA